MRFLGSAPAPIVELFTHNRHRVIWATQTETVHVQNKGHVSYVYISYQELKILLSCPSGRLGSCFADDDKMMTTLGFRYIELKTLCSNVCTCIKDGWYLVFHVWCTLFINKVYITCFIKYNTIFLHEKWYLVLVLNILLVLLLTRLLWNALRLCDFIQYEEYSFRIHFEIMHWSSYDVLDETWICIINHHFFKHIP